MMYNVQMSDAEIGPAISLAALGNVAVAQDEGGETSSCSYSKYGYVLNPTTHKYEYKVIWSCEARCVYPKIPRCDNFGCGCD